MKWNTDSLKSLFKMADVWEFLQSNNCFKKITA